MAFKVRPFLAVGIPALGQNVRFGYPATDGMRKVTTHHFGYNPDSCLFANLPYQHWGTGRRSIRCESSGEFFPENRIQLQYDGKRVGDPYRKLAPRRWPLSNGN